MKNLRVIRVPHFERCRAGETPEVLKARGKENSPIPGDGLFAEVEVEGTTFIMTVIAAEKDKKEVSPWKFEGALRGMLAALAKYIGAEQDPNVAHISEETEEFTIQ